MTAELQTVGAGGEVLLGDEHKGETVTTEEVEPGFWIIRSKSLVVSDQAWLDDPEVQASIDRGLKWAAENPARESDLNAMEQELLSRIQSKV